VCSSVTMPAEVGPVADSRCDKRFEEKVLCDDRNKKQPQIFVPALQTALMSC